MHLRLSRHRRWIATLPCLVAGTALGGGDPRGQPGVGQSPGPTGHLKTFAPGVRIDWLQKVVEVDARVVLRKGPLELLACSPQTREHESILSVRARPMHIFQAMGLIGLTPGSPARFDGKENRWFAPVGEPLELRIRYEDAGAKQRTVPAKRWLHDVKHRRPPERIDWVFSGSRSLEDGRFGADLDGTVVCVVDFDTALITVGALHSADNELLWLAANTKAIPPIGTACTLLIRGVAARTIEVDLAVDGTLRHEGKLVLAADLVRTVQRERGDRTTVALLLKPARLVSDDTVSSALDSLVRAGIDRAFIQVEPANRQPDNTEPTEKKTEG